MSEQGKKEFKANPDTFKLGKEDKIFGAILIIAGIVGIIYLAMN